MEFTNENKTGWKIHDKDIKLNLDNVISGKYYDNSKVVAFLIGEDSTNPEKLLVYNLNGEKLFDNSKPDGYQFMYLSSHPKAEIVVVCGIIDIESSEESWSDFYFKVNLNEDNLERIGIAR
ncbi:hypothetical protein [Bacillus sp. P14.5]|uniref:hypothetical protein n=1 Tax=Bacillus sp. P14.5 TaxID=1983400 RepID=UPI000DE8DC1D|nr:hypothetical protein [Bacillus sp. P14.5]